MDQACANDSNINLNRAKVLLVFKDRTLQSQKASLRPRYKLSRKPYNVCCIHKNKEHSQPEYAHNADALEISYPLDLQTIRVVAYSVPVMKRAVNATFCLLGSFNFRTIAMGRINIAISVAMFSPPWVARILDAFIHDPYVMVLSQAFDIGLQLNKNSNEPNREYNTVVIMTAYTMILNGRYGESRK